MRINQIPFNIELLIPTDRELKTIPRIAVLDIFKNTNQVFHPDGLFSTESFGKVGEERRNRTFGYIDLKLDVFHPIIFKAITDTKSLYGDILSGSTFAIWDDKLKDFIKSTPIEGETGFVYFLKHYKEIKFEERKSVERTFNIKMLYKYINECMFSELLVLPAGLRDFEIDETGRPREDEINKYYRKILSYSNLVHPEVYKVHPESLDDVRYSIQNGVNEVYDYLKNFVEGKKKLIQGKWCTRQIFNGTLNVASSLIFDVEELDSPKAPGVNDSLVGLYQFMKATLPVTIYNLKNGYLSNIFIGPNSPAVLVNKKTLRKEMVDIDPDIYDNWMTDEGLESTISKFGEEDLRHEPIIINNHYLCLIYKGNNKTYKLFSDINELPDKLDKKLVTPVTFYEIMYISVFKDSNTIPAFITRYPITGLGSTYPSWTYLKSTVKSETRTELDDDWKRTNTICYEFPIKNETSFNTVSPNSCHYGRLGLDS